MNNRISSGEYVLDEEKVIAPINIAFILIGFIGTSCGEYQISCQHLSRVFALNCKGEACG